MLRISITESPHNGAILRLEGHLAGPWIAELSQACQRILAEGRAVTLDLGDVSLIERSGFDLLVSLSRRAVSLTGCSPFQEEQLKQAAAAQSDTNTPS